MYRVFAVAMVWVLLSVVPVSAEDNVIATLNDRPIYLKDLQPDARTLASYKKRLPPDQFEEWLDFYSQDRLTGKIMGALLKDFGASRDVDPTTEEIREFITRMSQAVDQGNAEIDQQRKALEQKMKKPGLPEQEKEKIRGQLKTFEKMYESRKASEDYRAKNPEKVKRGDEMVAQQFIRRWKLNRALYREYGGRVIFQQAGPEPFDAYRKFLKEHEQKGTFKIVSADWKEPFWNYFTNEKMHTFLPDDEGKHVMTTPLWQLLDEKRAASPE